MGEVSACNDSTKRCGEFAFADLQQCFSVADRDLAVVVQGELRQSIKFMERFSNTLLRDYLGILRDVIFHKMTPEDWLSVIAVHLKGTFNVAHFAAIPMRQQRSGYNPTLTLIYLPHMDYVLQKEGPAGPSALATPAPPTPATTSS